MTPAVHERVAPDTPSGAAHSRSQVAVTVQPMTERDFWRAVFATLVVLVRSPLP